MISSFKYYLCVILIIILGYCCNVNSYSKAKCDRTDFHENNKLNDTGKVEFEDRVVFDTTVNRLSGQITDSASGKPIVKAWILITQDSREFIDTTDSNGEFTFFKDGFSGNWQMLVRENSHRCLQISNIAIGGGLRIKIKLSDYFNNPN